MNVDLLLETAGLKRGPNLLFELDSGQCKRIKIDVGLSLDAPHALRWLRDDPELFVMAFEPIDECVASIRDILKRPENSSLRKRLLLLQCALSDFNGTASMQVTEDFGTSSLEIPTKFEVTRVFETPVFRLDEILARIDLQAFPRIDYLKTDCQGHDFRVLQGVGKYLERVAIITCEAWAPGYAIKHADSELTIRKWLVTRGFRNLNRPGTAQVWLVSLLHNFRFQFLVRGLEAILSRRAKARKEGSPYIQKALGAQDPTFLNRKFEFELERGELSYYQTY